LSDEPEAFSDPQAETLTMTSSAASSGNGMVSYIMFLSLFVKKGETI
jgi:hypothetical protein